MKYDVWFCRYEDNLYAAVAEPDEPPIVKPRRVGSVKSALTSLKMNGHEIVQVGIIGPEMIGLEIEV